MNSRDQGTTFNTLKRRPVKLVGVKIDARLKDSMPDAEAAARLMLG